MPRLLSKKGSKDDFRIGFREKTLLAEVSPFNQAFIRSLKSGRRDDWDYVYNNPFAVISKYDINFLKTEVEKYRQNKTMPRLLSNKSPTKLSNDTFGNTLNEIKYIRSVLSEIGPEPTDAEIDRAITLAKVDMFQDKMEKFYDPEMVGNEPEINV